MKRKIVAYLLKHPRSRLRQIGGALGVWHISLVKDVHELVDAGVLVVEPYRNAANMEFYDLYSVRKRN